MDTNDDYQLMLEKNRAGQLTAGQKAAVLLGALVSVVGLLCLSTMMLSIITGLLAAIGTGSLVSWLFLLVFILTFAYLGLTFFANARMFVPDSLSRHPVRQARGRLKIREAARPRPELPFSYIVGDYSFAPYMVPAEIKMVPGQEYIVYYADSSRMFLGIEPVKQA